MRPASDPDPQPTGHAPPRQARKSKWVIEPRRAGLLNRAVELWNYRRLLWFFGSGSVRDLYEGTVLGWLWLLIRPAAPLVVWTLVFGRLLNVPSDGIPYFLFFVAGSATWIVFERSLLWTTKSLAQGRSLITKVYFPRLILPVASVAPAIVYFSIYMAFLVGAILYYGLHDGRWYIVFGPQLLLAPIAALMSPVLAIAVGLWTSVWQIRARDVQFTLRYFTQFWLYLTPVIYPLSTMPEHLRWIAYFNPMTAVVETFKWSILGVGGPTVGGAALSLALIAATLGGGVWYFDRSEAGSVDRI